MSSLRHNVVDREPRDAYLDAARDCILDVGWRRTTLTEVARRAGVSRMTIYRTWADMPTLLGDLMTREWAAVVTEHVTEHATEHVTEHATEHVGGADGLASGRQVIKRLAEGIVGTVRQLRANELFVRIVELDPELILPYLFSRRGRSQELILSITTRAIAEGQRSGEVREGNPVAIARGLLLAAHGFVLSVHTMVDDDASEAELDGELTLLIERTLRV
ncbi:MAG TPA: TetR family transcriptional regulator [Nocardioides bacterium]|uniref:TetR/AcrR family transcriptional regulator n=1 Tax=uncultured Nocardioides sp. TaxID=198441 RepID=UPI000EC4F2F4|nr:helix-turn-helix domain-containing protein [uncultured Nocardioides sp.]HCB07686.1 TetR family transcriptional regulator [Nocardioides sp.]